MAHHSSRCLGCRGVLWEEEGVWHGSNVECTGMDEVKRRQYAVPQHRPKYRRGRREKAVRVYTICDESVYIRVYNVPALNVVAELAALFSQFGDVERHEVVARVPAEYREVHLIKYACIEHARAGKQRCDGKSFYGAALDVDYAPECEDVTETREKLSRRCMHAQKKYGATWPFLSFIPEPSRCEALDDVTRAGDCQSERSRTCPSGASPRPSGASPRPSGAAPRIAIAPPTLIPASVQRSALPQGHSKAEAVSLPQPIEKGTRSSRKSRHIGSESKAS